MLIPQKVGRKLIVEDVFSDLSAVQKQKAVLDSLEASLQTVMAGDKNDDDKKKAKKAMEKVFAVKLHLVKDKKTIGRIEKKYDKTRNRVHSCNHLGVKTVYSVEIENMKKAFDKCKVKNVKELWHGTRASNLLSILKGGLIIPSASSSHCTGRMYGDGLYFSDQSTKSLNYAYGYWGNGKRDSNCFMFLCSVKMGKEYTPSSSYGHYPQRGYDSTFAKAGKSGVMNNEMIVYSLPQVNLNYLIEFSD